MFCPNCGYNNKETNKFCLKCGKDLSAASEKFINAQKPSDEVTYENACSDLNRFTNLKQLDSVKEVFINLGDFKDSKEKAAECEAKIDKIVADKNEKDYQQACKILESNPTDTFYYDNAIGIFSKLGDFKDSRLKVSECEAEKKKLIELKKADLYKSSCEKLSRPHESPDEYDSIKNKFIELDDYKDSKDKIAECDRKKEELQKELGYRRAFKAYSEVKANVFDADDYSKVISMFEALGDYKKSAEKAAELKNIVREEKLKAEKLKKRLKKIAVIAGASAASVLGILFFIGAVIVPENKYNDALEMLKSGKYKDSIELLEDIPGHKDSDKLLDYANACILLEDGNYEKARTEFEKLGYLLDCTEKIKECNYQEADSLFKDKMYSEAVSVFSSLGNYKDSAQKLDEIYNVGLSYMDDRKFGEAAEIFTELGNHKDCQKQLEKIYKQAEKYLKDKKYRYAAAVFLKLDDYEDSVEKSDELFEKAVDFVKDEKYGDAVPILMKFSEFESYNEKAIEQLDIIYDTASSYTDKYYYYSAIKMFENLGNYKDSEQKLSELKSLYDPDKDKKYNKAVEYIKNENYSDAIDIFEELGTYKDSATKIKDAELSWKRKRYDHAVNLMDQGYYNDAKEIFEELDGYMDSNTKISEIEEHKILDQVISGTYYSGNSGFSPIIDLNRKGYNFTVRITWKDSYDSYSVYSATGTADKNGYWSGNAYKFTVKTNIYGNNSHTTWTSHGTETTSLKFDYDYDTISWNSGSDDYYFAEKSSSPVAVRGKVATQNGYLNVRSANNTSADILGHIQKGEEVILLDEFTSDGWYTILYNNRAGFVSGDFIDKIYY